YRNLWVRRLTTLLTSTGMGLVVFVFAAVLMLADGLEKTLVSTGSEGNAVFIRRSSETEVQSILERDQAVILESLPDIDTGTGGEKLVARELVILIGLAKKSTNSLANVTVRGVKPDISFALRPQIRLTQGRPFRPGASEVVLGKSIAQRFAIGGLGQTIQFGTRPWTVVGIMDAGGAAFDSEIWADADLLMTAFRRPVYSSVIMHLRDPSLFPAVKEGVTKDPRLTVDAFREIDYYAAQSALMTSFIRILGITLTLIFSLGAIIGSMVTMYAAVANRVTEIGTLRALGFQRRTILSTFLAESLFLSLIGGLLGLLSASFMNRLTISTMNWQTFSELTFRFHLSQSVVVSALSFAAVMGLLGGMLPALRASRMDIVTALRAR
ncbi:MAG: FtsX-like permease family protein, partial [Syntrophobacteraceae bacterium]|nr:FtsX-like permease family protein [Syntrophobacteraceae bacterium]